MQADAKHPAMSVLPPSGAFALGRLKFGLFATGALLLALHVVERSGLPSNWAFGSAMVLLVGFALLLVVSDRTFDETEFTLARTLLPALGGGFFLGLLLGVVIPLLLRPADGSEALSVTVGSITGLLAAHMLVRRAGREPVALMHASGFAQGNGFFILLLGLLLLVPGGLMLHQTLPMAVQEVSVLTGGPRGASVLLVTGFFFCGLVLGGGRTILAGLVVMATLIGATLLLLLVEGFVAFGALPLPGLTTDDTLSAIAQARQRWISASPDHGVVRVSHPVLRGRFQCDGHCGLAGCADRSGGVTRHSAAPQDNAGQWCVCLGPVHARRRCRWRVCHRGCRGASCGRKPRPCAPAPAGERIRGACSAVRRSAHHAGKPESGLRRQRTWVRVDPRPTGA
jgi:hypothetical protein